MDLRLFLTAFATGICLVLFALITATTVFDSGPSRTSRPTPLSPTLDLSPTPGQGAEIAASQAPASGQQVQSQEANATIDPAPTGTPIPDASPTQEPAQPAVAGAPVPPNGLTATYTPGQGVALNWNPVAGSAYYNVYRSQLAGGGLGATYVALGRNGIPSFVDATATPGQTFFYVVTSSSGGSESPSSNEAVVQTP
jgi:hypothetical protein